MEQLLTAEDVARLVHKTPKTIRRWVARGILQGSRMGGQQLMFRASDVEAAFDRARTGVPSAPTPAPRPAATTGRGVSVSPAGSRLSVEEEFWQIRREREARLGVGATAAPRKRHLSKQTGGEQSEPAAGRADGTGDIAPLAYPSVTPPSPQRKTGLQG